MDHFFAIIAVAAVILIVVGVVMQGIARGRGRGIQFQKVCPQCGKPVKAEKNFCTGCGAEIK